MNRISSSFYLCRNVNTSRPVSQQQVWLCIVLSQQTTCWSPIVVQVTVLGLLHWRESTGSGENQDLGLQVTATPTNHENHSSYSNSGCINKDFILLYTLQSPERGCVYCSCQYDHHCSVTIITRVHRWDSGAGGEDWGLLELDSLNKHGQAALDIDNL